MGQYMTLVSPDREEYVNLPGGMKAVERVTNRVAMGILGYLVLEGPNDGTILYRNAEKDTERVREQAEEIKEREREIEEKNFKRYFNERPDYKTNKFEREHGATPDEAPEAYEEFCRDEAQSTYRNDDGSWDTDTVIKIALSHLEINETHEFAGRWGGCQVALTGDYSNKDWYAKTKKHTVVELPDGERMRIQGVRELCNKDGSKAFSHPISVSDIPYADSPGDHMLVKEAYHDVDEDTVGEVVRVEEPEYENITDGLIEEFTEIVGEDWVNGEY